MTQWTVTIQATAPALTESDRGALTERLCGTVVYGSAPGVLEVTMRETADRLWGAMEQAVVRLYRALTSLRVTADATAVTILAAEASPTGSPRWVTPIAGARWLPSPDTCCVPYARRYPMPTAHYEFATREGTVHIERDLIEYRAEHAAIPVWRTSDSAGHAHAYQREASQGQVWREGRRRKDKPTHYPTLRYIIDSRHRCGGMEGSFRHDPYWAVDDAHWECLICGETVVPEFGPWSEMIVSGQRAYLDGAPITGTRAKEILGAADTRPLTEAIEDQ